MGWRKLGQRTDSHSEHQPNDHEYAHTSKTQFKKPQTAPKHHQPQHQQFAWNSKIHDWGNFQLIEDDDSSRHKSVYALNWLEPTLGGPQLKRTAAQQKCHHPAPAKLHPGEKPDWNPLVASETDWLN